MLTPTRYTATLLFVAQMYGRTASGDPSVTAKRKAPLVTDGGQTVVGQFPALQSHSVVIASDQPPIRIIGTEDRHAVRVVGPIEITGHPPGHPGESALTIQGSSKGVPLPVAGTVVATGDLEVHGQGRNTPVDIRGVIRGEGQAGSPTKSGVFAVQGADGGYPLPIRGTVVVDGGSVAKPDAHVLTVQGVPGGIAVNTDGVVRGAGAAGHPDSTVVTVQGHVGATPMIVEGGDVPGTNGLHILSIQGATNGVPLRVTHEVHVAVERSRRETLTKGQAKEVLSEVAYRSHLRIKNLGKFVVKCQVGSAATAADYVDELKPIDAGGSDATILELDGWAGKVSCLTPEGDGEVAVLAY